MPALDVNKIPKPYANVQSIVFFNFGPKCENCVGGGGENFSEMDIFFRRCEVAEGTERAGCMGKVRIVGLCKGSKQAQCLFLFPFALQASLSILRILRAIQADLTL